MSSHPGGVNYEEWLAELLDRPKGRQRWRTREDFYLAIVRQPRAELPDVADLVNDAGASISTFYNTFGPSAVTRPFVQDEDARVVAVLEAKAWSFHPYRAGLQKEWEALGCGALLRVESELEALAAWAQEVPQLAKAVDFSPPPSAIPDIVGHLQIEPTAEIRSLLVRAIRLAVETDLTPVGVVNSVIGDIDNVRGADKDEDAVAAESHRVIEALSEFAEVLLAANDPGRSADGTATLLRRLADLIAGRRVDL